MSTAPIRSEGRRLTVGLSPLSPGGQLLGRCERAARIPPPPRTARENDRPGSLCALPSPPLSPRSVPGALPRSEGSLAPNLPARVTPQVMVSARCWRDQVRITRPDDWPCVITRDEAIPWRRVGDDTRPPADHRPPGNTR